jgi:type I restriction enzyme S subunit
MNSNIVQNMEALAKLPDTWQVVPFQNVVKDCSAGNKKIFKSEFLEQGDFAIVDQGKELIAGYTNAKALLVNLPPPYIVFGDHTRIFKYIDVHFAMGADGTKVLKPKEDGSIDEKYLYYFFLTLNIPDTGYNRHFKYLKSAKIPFPRLLTEQQKIAAILDAADSLRQKDRQLIDHYTALSQSLFLDMFGDPIANKNQWVVKKLSEVSTSQLGKMLSKKAKQNINSKKYLRNANVRWRHFDLQNVLEMDFDDTEIKKFNLSYGDLLVCEGGEVGRCAIWKDNLEDCYFQKALHRVRVNKTILTSEYLQEYFFWMAKLGGLNASVSEVTFSHLTAEKLKELKVPLPPITLQNQFAERIQQTEQQKQQAQASLEKSEALFNSLLQRAFTGELTKHLAA